MEGEDRISALPDGILCHILSFLPTRDTIATGRLSKRWRPLWYTIPVIDIHLDDQTYLRNGCIYSPFLNFAYAALLLRNTQQPLMLARLRINTRVGPNYTFPEAHLNIWVKAVLERGLQHLHLEMPRYLSLTSIVFNCRTLVVLKLHRVSVDILQSVDLPALKTLYLNCVIARETGYVSMILHRCPVLEELKVNRINFGIAEYHNIPTLMRADVGFDFGIEFPLKVVSNVQVLRYFLEYNHQLGFPMFQNLIYLNLNFVSYFKWDMVIQLLAHCPNLQNFVINMPVVTDVIEGWGYRQFAPSCISSKLRKCTIVNCRGLDCEVHFVKYMLHHSRVLQTMTIHHCLRNMWGKFRMLQRLAMCSRGSATCRLIFK